VSGADDWATAVPVRAATQAAIINIRVHWATINSATTRHEVYQAKS
jgi:hypothetical protein